MARIFYAIYIGHFIMALSVMLLSNNQQAIESAIRVLNDSYGLFKLCVVTILYGIFSQLEKKNRTNL